MIVLLRALHTVAFIINADQRRKNNTHTLKHTVEDGEAERRTDSIH